jgi:preprotein translocase subunit SecA
MLQDRYRRIAGEASLGATSLWADGTDLPAHPAARLQVLAPHRPELTRNPIDAFAARVLGLSVRFARPQRRLSQIAARIAAQRPTFAALDGAGFAAAVTDVARRSKFEHNAGRDRIGALEMDALAVVSEAVFRVNGFYPHREQLMGAITLLEGSIAEMATGEGKTLTAMIAAIVAAWRGLPCHVVTSNDYLAARDCEIGQPLFALCGVSAASVTGDTAPDARGNGYAHDVVYTTAKDMLADHLRDAISIRDRADRHAFALEAARSFRAGGTGGGTLPVVMRGVFQLVVDEADSVLIDEAVTPLIISESSPDSLLNEAAGQAVMLARSLRAGVDFVHDQRLKTVDLTQTGRDALARMAMQAGPFWHRPDRSEELVTLALHAIHLLRQDQHYVIEDDKVVLIDELTGRLARQRTLSLGLQQVLEASLALPLSDPTEVRARLSFQRYFRRLPRLGGMTGTAHEARSELAAVYGLRVIRIPTHRKVRRIHARHRIFRTEGQKFAAIARESLRLSRAGHAVLIGVRSVRSSAALANAFAIHAPEAKVAVLNAVNDAEESAIVALAGLGGAITVATNMAGRGTDIKIDPGVEALGGLNVLIGESNDFGRIDRQLIGRSARQGDPGRVERYISTDDEVIRRFLPKPLALLWRMVFPLTAICPWLAYRLIRIAQSRAEALALRQRGQSLKAETDMEKGMV